MKFDDQLASYLYENKKLALEGIGTFTLDSKVSVPGHQEKEVFYPIDGLLFIYNPKANSDEELIAYIVKKLHKIEPLIRSDLESYLSNIKQFLNLGKPYTIEGIGTLSKNNQGTYEFTPGNFLPVKEELHPLRENAEHNYPVRSQSNAGRVFVIILVVVAALAALGGFGWGISNFLSNRHTAADNEQEISDSSVKTDTLTTPNKQVAIQTNPATSTSVKRSISGTDTVNYKMYFEVTTDKQRAHRRTMQLHSYHHNNKYDTIHVGDLVKYRLFLPMRIRVADTTKVKDSLSVFLGSKVFILK